MCESTTSPAVLPTTTAIDTGSESDLTPSEESSEQEQEQESSLEYELSSSDSRNPGSSFDDPGSIHYDDRDYIPQMQDSPDSQQVDATSPRPSNLQQVNATSPRSPHSPNLQQLNATSPRNIFYKEMPTEKTRMRVVAAAPAGGRCLITLVKIGKPRNKDSKYAADIAYCHAIARALALRIIRIIEWQLGMKAGTLNLNSRWNIILMRFDVHPWYDGMGFVLIPSSLDLLKEMQKLIRHNEKQSDPKARLFYKHGPLLNSATFHYRVVVVHMDPDRSWSREDTTPSTGTSKARPIWHDYPFTDDTMQNIESHLNPFFALYHARTQIDSAIKRGYVDEDFWFLGHQHPLQQTMLLAYSITDGLSKSELVPMEFMNDPGYGKTPESPTHKSAVTNPPAIWSSGRRTRSVAQASSQADAQQHGADLDDVFSSGLAAASSSRPAKKRTRLDLGQSAKGKEKASTDSQSVDSESRGQKRPHSLSP